MARLRPTSRSSSSRRGASCRRASSTSTTSEDERRVAAAPPSPRCVKRRDFKAQGRARSRAKNLRRMEEVEGGAPGAAREPVVEPPHILVEAWTVGEEGSSTYIVEGDTEEDTDGQARERDQVFFFPETSATPCLETAESFVVEGHSTMDCVEEEEHITMVLEEQATIIKERQTDFEDQLATMEEEETSTEEQQATVVMRKNEHNEFLTRTSEAPQKPDTLDLQEQEQEQKQEQEQGQEKEQEQEQEQESSSGFWTHRSSVISIADSARGSSVLEAGSPTESVRDFLMQKRSSLTHTPDVVRMLQKLEQQQVSETHEFQKVKNELKHVDEEATTYAQLDRVSQLATFSNINSKSSSSFDSQEHEVVTEDTSSRNMVINLMPAPIKPFGGAPENETGVAVKQKKEPKASAPTKVGGGTAPGKRSGSGSGGVGSRPRGGPRERPRGGPRERPREGPRERPREQVVPPKSAKSAQQTLQSPNLIQQAKPAQNGTDKPPSLLGNGTLETPSLLKEVNGVPKHKGSQENEGKKKVEKKRGNSPGKGEAGGGGVGGGRRHVPRPQPPSQRDQRSKSPDRKPPSCPPHTNTPHPDQDKTRKQSNASVTSIKSNQSDQERRGAFKATEPIAKGGFLAPTKAWLSLRGENVNLTSRSPSPKLSLDSKERSVSPRRRLRESSAESDSQSRKSVSFGVKERKVIMKDPTLPNIRRSASLRGTRDVMNRNKGVKKASMENLASQNGNHEGMKVTKDSLKKVNVVNKTVRSRDSSKENVEIKNSIKKRETSKDKSTVKTLKNSSMRSRDSSKTDRDVAVKSVVNGVKCDDKKSTAEVTNISNMEKTTSESSACISSSSKTNKQATNTAVNGAKTSVTSIDKKFKAVSKTSINQNKENRNSICEQDAIATSAILVKSATGKMETQIRAEAREAAKGETGGTKVASGETSASEQSTATSTTSSSSTVSGRSSGSNTSKTSQNESSEVKKASMASMSQMKMVQNSASAAVEVTAAETTESSQQASVISMTTSETKSTSESSNSSTATSNNCAVNNTNSISSSSSSNNCSSSKTSQSSGSRESSRSSSKSGVKARTTSSAIMEGSTGGRTRVPAPPRPLSPPPTEGGAPLQGQEGGAMLRTTMVVRFRPSEATQQGTWLAELQPGDTSSICGLEISFSSVPQDIDIKMIPGDGAERGTSPPKVARANGTQ